MSGLQGSGDIEFGSNVLVFRAEDGITESGVVVPVVVTTPTGSATETKDTGDCVDWGTFGGVVIADDTVDVEALVNTSESTTITYPLGGNSTAKTKAGTAKMTQAIRSGAKNVTNLYNVEFVWTAKPTITDAT